MKLMANVQDANRKNSPAIVCPFAILEHSLTNLQDH